MILMNSVIANAISGLDKFAPLVDEWEPVGWGLAGAACLLVPIITFIIWLAIAIWMYKDAKKRDENAVLWLIIGLILGLIGLIIWIVVRPDMDEVMRKRREKQQYQQQQYQQPPPPGQGGNNW